MTLAWTCLALAVGVLYLRHKVDPHLRRLAIEQQRTPGAAVVTEFVTVASLIALTGTALLAALRA